MVLSHFGLCSGCTAPLSMFKKSFPFKGNHIAMQIRVSDTRKQLCKEEVHPFESYFVFLMILIFYKIILLDTYAGNVLKMIMVEILIL